MTVTPDVPVLDMEMARVFVVPTFTLPKSRLDKEKWKEAEAGADEEAGAEPPPPPQPDSRTAATAAHSTTLRQPEASAFKFHLRTTSSFESLRLARVDLAN